MRKSPEGKWQGTSVPLDGATLAVMQEYVRVRSEHHRTHTDRHDAELLLMFWLDDWTFISVLPNQYEAILKNRISKKQKYGI